VFGTHRHDVKVERSRPAFEEAVSEHIPSSGHEAVDSPVQESWRLSHWDGALKEKVNARTAAAEAMRTAKMREESSMARGHGAGKRSG
jgi:hypothetical protein